MPLSICVSDDWSAQFQLLSMGDARAPPGGEELFRSLGVTAHSAEQLEEQLLLEVRRFPLMLKHEMVFHRTWNASVKKP